MDEQTIRSDFTAILEDNGYRLTAPRREIIGVLEAKQEGFAAEEIVAELPDLGRATIYRTLKLLLEAGAICRLNMLDGAPGTVLPVSSITITQCASAVARYRSFGPQLWSVFFAPWALRFRASLLGIE